MDNVSAGEATRDGARTRRGRMRDQARQLTAQPPVFDRYQTPEWLERTFVLPLQHPEASDVPSQTVPHHDDDPEPSPEPRVIAEDSLATSAESAPPAQFLRPPSEDIDFARVVRRADLCRNAGHLGWASAGLAGLALIAYLLMTSMVVLGVVIVFAVVALASFALRIRLSHAPVPRLSR
jgi:hypothetical protein